MIEIEAKEENGRGHIIGRITGEEEENGSAIREEVQSGSKQNIGRRLEQRKKMGGAKILEGP